MGDCREKETGFVLCGTFVHSTDDDPMIVIENHCLGVVDGKVGLSHGFLDYVNRSTIPRGAT